MEEETVVLDFDNFSSTDVHKSKVVQSEKHIREYTIDGQFVKHWNNVLQVSRAFGVPYNDIRRCVEGKNAQVKGRVFLAGMESILDRLVLIKKEQEKEALMESIEREYAKTKEIKVYTSSGEYLRTCHSTNEASEIYKIPRGIIQNHFYNKSCVTNGLVFIPYGETIEERLKKIKNRKTHKNNL